MANNLIVPLRTASGILQYCAWRISHLQPGALSIGQRNADVKFIISMRAIKLQYARDRKLLANRTERRFQELGDVVTETQPGVVWEVFVGLPPGEAPNAKSPSLVGSMSLLGAGVRNEAHAEFKPAHFLFPLNRAPPLALKANQERLDVTLVPAGILIHGKPSRPEVKPPVHVGKVRRVVQIRRHGGKEGAEPQSK